MDPLSMLTGAGLLSAGLLIGVPIGVRRGRAPLPIKATCECGHSLAAQHDPDTGRCQAQDMRMVNYTDRWVPCTCRQYVGPKPIESLYQPPILRPGNG